MQSLDRRDGARRQHLVPGDEGAVDIGDDERDLVHDDFAPRVSMSTPSSEATTTVELRPTNSPFSTTPTIELIDRSVSCGSSIGPNRQSRMKLPPSVTKGCPDTATRSSGSVPSRSSAAAVACQP